VRTTTPAAVVRAYLVLSGLFTLSASVIWGVNTLFLLDAGLDIFQVFAANAAFTAGMVLFEIPTGVVADTSGRRRSFLLSAAILLAGTLGYVGIAAAGGGLVPFLIASVVLGLGFSFYSGAVEAWLVDALGATGYEGQLDPVFARGEMVSGAAMLIGSVGGGFPGGIGLAGSFWPAPALLLLLSVADGVGMPVQQAYLHQVIPSAQRATVASSVSLVGSAGGIAGQIGLGYVARAQSVAAGYVAGGLVMLAVLPPLLVLRRMGGQPDRIAGTSAGVKAPCAAQGLPAVASIDTTVRQPQAQQVQGGSLSRPPRLNRPPSPA
jgi:MFS family permease